MGRKNNTDNKKWDEDDIFYLKENWLNKSDEDIGTKLNRSKYSISAKRVELGLKRMKQTTWTEEEKEFLISNFYLMPQNELELKLKRNYNAISSYANKVLNLNRKKGKYISDDGKMRLCKECQKWLPNNSSYFYPDRSTLRCTCKECDFILTERQQRSKGVITNLMKREMFDNEGKKYCNKCKQWHEKDNFYSSSSTDSSITGYQHWCMNCSKIYYVTRQINKFLKTIKILDWSNKEIENIYQIISSNLSYDDLKESIKNKLNSKKVYNICYQYVLSSAGVGKVFYASNGMKCLSLTELIVNETLIMNDINFIKEPRYKELIPKDRRRFDWKILFNDKQFYIEYFGLYSENPKTSKEKVYKKNTIKKIKDLEKFNNIIFLYPNDFTNDTYIDILENKLGIKLKKIDGNIKIIKNKVLNEMTDEEFIKEIMKYSSEPDMLPTMYFIYNHYGDLYEEINRRYGNYCNMAQTFNLKVKIKPKNYWTKDILFEKFLYMIEKYGEILNDRGTKIYELDYEIAGINTAYKTLGRFVDLKLEFLQWCCDKHINIVNCNLEWLYKLSKSEYTDLNKDINLKRKSLASKLIIKLKESHLIK